MTARAARLTLTAALLTLTAGCFGGSDTEARAAAEQLAGALAEPDAAAVRELVGAEDSTGRTDLLTDAVVAENAFAGRDVEIDADIERFNGYGTFTLTSPDVPDRQVQVQQRLTETRTPRGLETVTIGSRRPLRTLLVNDHRIDLAEEPDQDGPAPSFYLPPGVWTIDLPPNPFVDTESQTVEVGTRRPPPDVTLGSSLNAAGRVEAVRLAEAYVAACERSTPDPRDECGGGLSVCAGERTTREVSFSPAPRWTVDADRGTLTHQPDLQRTVTTTCTDRETGVVSETTRRTEPADLGGTLGFTDTGLSVDLR